MALSYDQVAAFHRSGYLVIPAFLSPETISSLLAETHHLLSTFPLSSHPLTRFTTGDDKEDPNTKHISDDYFLSSGDKIRFFFEPSALSTSSDSPTPQLLYPKEASINKIGHSLHTLSPPFRDVTLACNVAAMTLALGYTDPRVLQSMVICKQPHIGAAVPPHQDSTFLYTNPPSALGFWIALEDATKGNGCLSFKRGSHKYAPVTKRFVRLPQEGGGVTTGFEALGEGESAFPRGETPEEQECEGEYELAEIPAGSLILIHGNLLHKSEKNDSPNSRFIYTFHVIEGANTYDQRNWLQPSPGSDGFSKLVDVSG
ncbi:MAG: hypothetical protein M1829_005573 [Trizodia sp. TS-e1964]|nr:MAG: hypothetical protein M1829_005573 [Trizodia sp. TS-e1964]